MGQEPLDSVLVLASPHSWHLAISEFTHHLRATGLLESSVRVYEARLRIVARALSVPEPWSVTGAQLVAWTVTVAHWKADTRRGYRTTLRVFYRWAVEAGHVAASPALALPRVRPPAPRPSPTPDEVYRLALATADDRERLLLRLAAEHGLRRCELALVHSRDLLEDLTGLSLLVHGKGQRDRVVPLTPDVARMLRALPAGYAFPGGQGGHISPWWIGQLLSRLMPEGWTTHKLRHRAGTRWYRSSGHDLAAVQELLGHADPKTTRVYVANDREQLRRIVNAAA